jgi:hypothetical protein
MQTRFVAMNHGGENLEWLKRLAIENLIRSLWNEDFKKKIRDNVARVLARGSDVALTFLFAWVDSILKQSDGIILAMGDTPEKAVGSLSTIFFLVSIFRYLGGWSLIQRVLSKVFGLVSVLIVGVLLSQYSPALSAGIDGPSQSPAGRLIKLTARVEPKSKMAWFAFPPDKADSIFVDNQLIFTGPPGRYVVYLVEFPEGGGQSQVMATIDILESPPGPGPLPPPLPPVPPAPSPLPDGQFRLSAWAYSQATPINDPVGAKALSEDIKALVSAYAAGTLKSPNDMLRQLRAALDARGPAWQPFRLALQSELNRQDFKSKPAASWVAASNELILGLEAIK